MRGHHNHHHVHGPRSPISPLQPPPPQSTKTLLKCRYTGAVLHHVRSVLASEPPPPAVPVDERSAPPSLLNRMAAQARRQTFRNTAASLDSCTWSAARDVDMNTVDFDIALRIFRRARRLIPSATLAQLAARLHLQQHAPRPRVPAVHLAMDGPLLVVPLVACSDCDVLRDDDDDDDCSKLSPQERSVFSGHAQNTSLFIARVCSVSGYRRARGRP